MPGWDVEAHAYSVLSGRTQEEIAHNLPARKTKRKTAGAADRVWDSSRPAQARPRKAAPQPLPTAAPAHRAAKKKPRSTSASLKGARAGGHARGHRADEGHAGRPRRRAATTGSSK